MRGGGQAVDVDADAFEERLQRRICWRLAHNLLVLRKLLLELVVFELHVFAERAICCCEQVKTTVSTLMMDRSTLLFVCH